MKQLILAAVLAATTLGAQAASFRLSDEPIAIAKDLQIYAVQGSVVHDNELIYMKVKSVSTKANISDFHTISINPRQCASGIVRLHWHDVQTAELLTKKDHGIDDGTIGATW